MRELFELINEYPWISVFVTIVGLLVLNEILEVIVRIIDKIKK